MTLPTHVAEANDAGNADNRIGSGSPLGSLDFRIKQLSKKCRNRGGDCPCRDRCQAVDAINEALRELETKRKLIDREIDDFERTRRRLTTPMATLREGFTFDERYEPVIVFDGDEATFGYEDKDGEWIEANVWPFNESVVLYDDCERLGIRVE